MKVICLIIGILFFPVAVCAKSLTVMVPVSSLNGDQEMTVLASSSGLVSTDTIYIKGAFFSEGSSNYFGYTKFGDSWIKNSATTTSQKKVNVGEWDGQLTVKPDYTDTGFTESGMYQFKVGFYTIASDTDPSSVKWSNTVSIFLEKPLPTLTPVPTNTQHPTSVPTLIPTNVPLVINTSIPINVPTVKKKMTPTPTEMEEVVLGTHSEATPTGVISVTSTPTPVLQSHTTQYAIVFVFVGAGIGILALVSVVGIIRNKSPHSGSV